MISTELEISCAVFFRRMNKLSEEMLQDLDKETITFVPNFDGSLKEPSVLPAKAPNLLINGSSGIAVGMATNIPPHNMSEVCEGAIKLIDDSKLTPEELMQTIKGPDFPTGGIIQGNSGIKDAYKTGRGKLRVRAKIEIEEDKKKIKLIVTEIPYQVNKSQLIEEIAHLVRDKKIQGISGCEHQIDVYWEFIIAGIRHRVAVECKNYSDSVSCQKAPKTG